MPKKFELPKKSIEGDTLEEKMTENAYNKILPARYLEKDKNREPTETPEEMFKRVADNIAQAEKEYMDGDYEYYKDRFYNMMTDLKFMPNSPTLMNAGGELQQLSACFVIHPEDSMDSIFSTNKDAAMIHKSGGGTGYPFHLLRPKGDIVNSTGGISSGPVSFMNVFDATCFPGHTEVLTPSGFEQINSLNEGDRVINRDGETEEVADKKVREIDEEIVELELSRLNKTIEVTKEHPFQVAENGKLNWKEAQELTEEDEVVIQSMEEETALNEELDLANLVTGHFIIRDTELELSREFYNADKGTASSFTRNVSKQSFANLVGWYLAEGCVSYQRGIPSTVNFTLHIDEEDYRDEILQDLDEMSLDYTVTETPERTKQDITIYNSSFAAFIENIFGCGYDTKQVPEFFWKAETETQLEIIEALFKGDGHLQKRNKGKSQRAAFKLANKELIDFVWHVGMKEGVQFSRSVERNQSKSDAYSAKVSVSSVQETGFERLFDEVPEGTRLTDRTKQELLLHPKTETKQEKQVVGIKNVETKPYTGKVHNLTVTGDHTYIAEGVTVHNCGTVMQGGKRRGAQMGVMKVDHPDILRFITAKRQENQLNNFNISVGFTEEFMEAVKNKEKYTLKNPRTGYSAMVNQKTIEFYSPDPENWPTAFGSDQGMDQNFWRDISHQFPEKINRFKDQINLEKGKTLELPAEFIFEVIVDGAWRNGEPGLYNYDEANKMHSFDLEKHPEKRMEATNPCCVEGTLVNTPNGYTPVEEIKENDVISTVKGKEHIDKIKSFDNRTIYKVTLSDGGIQYVTEDHRYHVIRSGSSSKQCKDIPLRELKEGDYIRVEPTTLNSKGDDKDYERGKKQGILLGDGCYTKRELNQHNRIHISTSEDDTEYNETLRETFNEYGLRKEDHSGDNKSMKIVVSNGQDIIKNLSLTPAKSPEKTFDITKIDNIQHTVGLLDGLLASDGDVNLHSNHPQVRFSTTSHELAQNIRRLLLLIGCHARITSREREGGTINGRKIKSENKLYTVNLSGASLGKFIEYSNLKQLHPRKGEDLEEIRDKWMTTGNTWKSRIKSIDKLDGFHTVYDLYCSGSDTWITDGYVQRGCAEQPLMNYESCNLGHINLSIMIRDDADTIENFLDKAGEDELDEVLAQKYVHNSLKKQELQQLIKDAVRFLDNVIDMSNFPLDKIEEEVRKHRKIGLGIMGFAQMLMQLGVPYDSKHAKLIAEQTQNFINQEAVLASHELALERGNFPEWYKTKWANPTENTEWMDKLAWKTNSPIKMRNHKVTTVAPTGTTSMIANTSGGIEPIFSLAYMKNVGKDIQGNDMLLEFDDYFLKTLKHNNINIEKVKTQIKEKMQNGNWNGLKSLDTDLIPEKFKDIFKTAQEINPQDHLEIQAAFQKHNHSGISKTINMPSTATRKDVKDIYMQAYEKGVKGTTVYRDKSRSTQVMNTNKNQENEKGGDK